jgi:hypothetical protein
MKLSLLNKIGLSLLLICYFYFSYIKFFNIPPHLFIIFLILACNFYNLKESVLFLSSELKAVFLSLFIVTAISAISTYQESFSNYKEIFEYIFKFSFLPVAIFLVIDVTIKIKKDIDFFERAIIAISTITISIAIFQHFGINWAWDLRQLIQGSGMNGRLSEWFAIRDRPMGLAYHNITLTYQSLIFSSLLISYFLSSKERNYLTCRNLILLFGFINILILKSRSLFFGLGLAFFIAYIYKNKKSILRYDSLKSLLQPILIFLVLATIFAFFIISQHKAVFDNTFASRFYHIYAGLNIFLDHLVFGIANVPYQNFSHYYLVKLDTYIPSYIYDEGVHNSYLSALLKNGIFILAPLFFTYKIWIKNNLVFSSSYKRTYYFFLVYIISYSFHSFFHNQGIFTGDQLFWLMFSFLVVNSKLHKSNFKK